MLGIVKAKQDKVCLVLCDHLDRHTHNNPDEKLTVLRQEAFVSLLSWIEAQGTTNFVGGEQNRLVSCNRLLYLNLTHHLLRY